ncbi:hypothetical protein Schulenberg_059 [Escherichia phage Schulenburg]|nr:hypothetical protein Schulenberg_059 [Escherichia phage Schulenburg]
MFKKGQLVKVKGTRAFCCVEWCIEIDGLVKVKNVFIGHYSILHTKDIELIGNNFKFKGAK